VIIFSSIGLIFAGFILYVYFHSPFSPYNLAAEITRPMEKALVKAGGVKKCSLGDPGFSMFGVANLRPSHTGVYQLQVGRQEAIEIITRIGKENGYDFKTDKSIDDVNAGVNFIDQTSKRNPYSELHDGFVYASGGVDPYGSNQQCGVGTELLTTNESQTIVYVYVSLPDRKK
jgi:hypothetical protein